MVLLSFAVLVYCEDCLSRGTRRVAGAICFTVAGGLLSGTTVKALPSIIAPPAPRCTAFKPHMPRREIQPQGRTNLDQHRKKEHQARARPAPSAIRECSPAPPPGCRPDGPRPVPPDRAPGPSIRRGVPRSAGPRPRAPPPPSDRNSPCRKSAKHRRSPPGTLSTTPTGDPAPARAAALPRPPPALARQAISAWFRFRRVRAGG